MLLGFSAVSEKANEPFPHFPLHFQIVWINQNGVIVPVFLLVCVLYPVFGNSDVCQERTSVLESRKLPYSNKARLFPGNATGVLAIK